MSDSTSPYAKGLYKAMIKSQRFGITPKKEGKKQTRFFEIDVVVKKKVNADGSVEPVTAPIHTNISIYLTAATIEKAFALDKIRATGAKSTKFSELDPKHDNFEDLAGNEITVYHGAKSKYDWDVFSGKGGRKAESNPEVADELDDLFGDSLAEADLMESVATPPNNSDDSKEADQSTDTPNAADSGTDEDEEFPF